MASLNDSVVITDAKPLWPPGPRIVFVNDALLRQTGYGRDELLGQTPRIFQGAGTDPEETRRIGESLRAWKSVRAELVNYNKDGAPFIVELDIVPIHDLHGDQTHWVSIQRDVTLRKKAEAEAGAATGTLERAEAIGQLAKGIAHDFNNIVAAILGNVLLAEESLGRGMPVGENLLQIKRAGYRARELIQQILKPGQRQSDDLSVLSVRSLLLEAASLWRATMAPDTELTLELPADDVLVAGDETQIQQVLLNLGVNAIHALPATGGRLRLVAGVVDIDGSGDETDANGSPLLPGRHVRIELSDNGHGFDERTRRRIFEPYFTTKPLGQGTGLGLSLVHGIVAAHQGRISVRSELGIGTVFTMLFPLAGDAMPVADQETSAPQTLSGVGQHILCLDDDDVVLLMTSNLLTHLGYRVSTFTAPQAAIDAVRASARNFDAVVTDFNMAGLSGLDVARELTSIDPDLPVVLCSGLLSEELRIDANAAGVKKVFDKQFVAEELGGLLQEVLATGPIRDGPHHTRSHRHDAAQQSVPPAG